MLIYLYHFRETSRHGGTLDDLIPEHVAPVALQNINFTVMLTMLTRRGSATSIIMKSQNFMIISVHEQLLDMKEIPRKCRFGSRKS